MPLPTSFVVTKASKTRLRTSGGMPGPSSATCTSMQLPSRSVVIVMVPSSPSASIALSSRFVHTWLSWEPRTVMRGRSAS